MSGFQNQVNSQPAPFVAGDRVSMNPIATVDAGPGGFVAGPLGLTVGKFAWVSADGITVTNSGQYPAVPDGFVPREQQGLTTDYLAQGGMKIPAGFPVTLIKAGDYASVNTGPSATTRRGSIYANYADGSVTTAAGTAGSVTATLGSTNTGSLGATFTGTASVASTTLVVTAVTGLISIGDTVSGSGITDAPTIVSQNAGGTVGGAGTYILSKPETCTGGTVTCFGSVVNITAVSTYISVGDSITKANFPASSTITGQTSGTTGGVGVYTTSQRGTQYVASGASVLTFGYTVAVTAVGSGNFLPGQPVVDATTGGNVPANSVIATQISGTAGQTGFYTLTLPATAYAAGDNLTTTAGIALPQWTAQTAVASGETEKISTWGA